MKKHIGIMWSVVHFGVEVICFQYFTLFFGSAEVAFIFALMYDILAFFPQIYIAALSERFTRLPVGLIGAGMVLLGAAGGFTDIDALRIAGFVVLSLGNAFVHVGGAEATLCRCGERMTPSAVFVAGGALGVGIGKYLGAKGSPVFIGWAVMLLCSLLIPLSDRIKGERVKPRIRMADTSRPFAMIVIMSFFVVAIRGMLSYGIPMSWNTTIEQTVLVFAAIGLGKGLGGVLSDTLGARRTAIGSTVLSLPLILLGGDNMWLSLAGIVLFSMTMATTLGILVSALPDMPLIGYGVTTTGLLAGVLPVFLPSVKDWLSQSLVLTVLSGVCAVMLWVIMLPDKPLLKSKKITVQSE